MLLRLAKAARILPGLKLTSKGRGVVDETSVRLWSHGAKEAIQRKNPPSFGAVASTGGLVPLLKLWHVIVTGVTCTR